MLPCFLNLDWPFTLRHMAARQHVNGMHVSYNKEGTISMMWWLSTLRAALKCGLQQQLLSAYFIAASAADGVSSGGCRHGSLLFLNMPISVCHSS